MTPIIGIKIEKNISNNLIQILDFEAIILYTPKNKNSIYMSATKIANISSFENSIKQI